VLAFIFMKKFGKTIKQILSYKNVTDSGCWEYIGIRKNKKRFDAYGMSRFGGIHRLYGAKRKKINTTTQA
jgi:hypothetical protein